jgi:alkylhydroperoxidase family enzyme
MRLREPRIPPLDESQWDNFQRGLIEPTEQNGQILNIFRTLVRHPKLLKRWLVFANHIFEKSTIPPREREMLILRIGWLCRAGYEWGQHVRIGRDRGLSDDEIRRIAAGPDAPGWNAFDAALLRAVDELHQDAFISDATWQALAERYSEEQLLDVVFTVGQYQLVSMALNTLGVQLEEPLDKAMPFPGTL